MKKSYLYGTLDKLVSQELNPSVLFPNAVPAYEIEGRIKQIRSEKKRITEKTHKKIFAMRDEKEMGLLVYKYYNSLVLLINKTWENIHHEKAHDTNSVALNESMLSSLTELLSYLEKNYSGQMTNTMLVPLPKMIESKALMESKMDMLKEKLIKGGNGEDLMNVVLSALNDFMEKIDRRKPMDRRELNYHMNLVRDLEQDKGQKTAMSDCPSLHELLIYWNLNSKECIRYFNHGLDIMIGDIETLEGKLEFVRFQHKTLGQIPAIPDFVYDPQYPSIKKYFGEYLQNEIDYMENELLYLQQKEIGFVPLDAAPQLEEIAAEDLKVRCNLSIDQIGLILRAADEKRIISARSLNSVFKSLVPFMSTKNKENLSWQSMRTKAYSGEDRDKEIAIEALEQMIEKIKEY